MSWGKVLLLLLALATTWGSPWCGAQQIKTTTPIQKRTFTLPSNCPTSCGNISIQYPFGIGNGCYLPGFDLTCREQINGSSMLFMGDENSTLEVTSIDLSPGYVHFKLPVITMGAHQSSITATPLIDLQNYHHFNFWSTDNFLFVSGCNVIADLVDFINNNNTNNCSTICTGVGQRSGSPYAYFSSPYTIRHQKCTVRIGKGLPDRVFLGVRLTRFNLTKPKASANLANPAAADVVRAYMSSDFKLSWYMDDHSSCTEARNDTRTYACISSNSNCSNALSVDRDVTVGYYCRCSGGTEGNPYLTDGCKDITANIYPANNCTRKCGSADIPFPFGLDNEPNCYRNSLFALVCNRTTTPPLLQYQGKIVTEVEVESGELHLMEVRNSSQGLTLTEGRYVYSWLISYNSCEDAKKNKPLFACVSEHIKCHNINDSKLGDHLGYRCRCDKGYTGNPYVQNGCQDINECKDPAYICKGICTNTEGSYNCMCEPGTYGNPKIGECIPYTKKRTLMFVLIIAAGNVCLLLLCVMLVILRKKWKEIMQKQIRKKNFIQNRGLLLEKRISNEEHHDKRTNLFSLGEIEKATDNFAENRIVGSGGYGVVYKGILSDRRVIAVKKSTKIEKGQIDSDQFINEIAILSGINHRHIVKLFGCCLETEIPLLVYEFISNDTLSSHLHVPNGQSKLSWADRLRIATEVASSLNYLQSGHSISIFHRDVKSVNILLDDNLVAKVSDFGASIFIPLDKKSISTDLQGTSGYVDPEYRQTGKFTDKSDVYSFGIVLLELLTGKTYYSTKHGDQNLAVNLLKHLQAIRENHALDIVEDRVLKEGNKEELLEIMQMIEMCLRFEGTERPTMGEVEHKLQGLRMTKKKLPSFTEDNDITQTNLSDATELVDQKNQGTSTSYSSEKDLIYQQSNSLR